MSPYTQYLVILFASLAVSIGLQLILPHPYGLVVSLALFIVFPLIYKRILIRSNGAGRFGGIEMGNKFYMMCVVCGKKTKDRQCPRCGSKSFKMGS